MLTSKPPFQSSTTDEIYRRARERDYEWPTADVSQRHISQDAKDMVAMMFEHPDQRPDPDAIVQHPFFTLGYMPTEADLSSRLRELPPERPDFYATRMSSSMQAQSQRNLKDMCRECGVGPWTQVQMIHTQIWKEMAAEEKAGLTPVIPLAENMVYRPFDEIFKDQQHRICTKYASSMVSHLSMPTASSHEDPLASTHQATVVGLLRQPPQSFAAQQRAQGRPPAVSAKPLAEPPPAPQPPQPSRAGPRQEAAAPAVAPKEMPERAARGMRSSARTTLPSARSAPSLKVAERAAAISSEASTPIKSFSSSDSIRPTTLFDPDEKTVEMAGTKPDVILDRLRRLQTELERALNSRTMAIISSRAVTPPHPHVVVKWVDYTNKFGLGYILNDGSVGCILRDVPTTEGAKTAMLPPAGIFIRGAERHILRRQDESYADRNQPIPMTEPIKFFENNGESGLAEVAVSPEQFRVAVGEDGTAGKMNPGKDIYQHRKRERIILWKKFANYMMAYGRDEAAVSPDQRTAVAEPVTFYQRFGDVGCWVFCDGHLQVRTGPCATASSKH